MNLFLFVRRALGLSQEALAQLLGIQTGLLKMVEINRRNLPSTALQRLAWMVAFVQNLPASVESPKFDPETVAHLLHKTRKKKREIDRVLQSIEAKRSQMKNRLSFQSAFFTQYPKEAYPSETSRMVALAVEAETFLKNEDTGKELEFRTRQAALAIEIAFLEQLI